MSASILPTTPGIYLIVNAVNHHMYVGSTYNLRKRYYDHFYALRKGTHKNSHLQSAYDLYGSDAFAFCVVDHVSDISKLIEREQLFIDFVKPVYNKAPAAGSTLGMKLNLSSEHRARLSANLTSINKARVWTPDIIEAREAKRKATREAKLLENPDAFRKTPEGIARSTEAARAVNLGSTYSLERRSKQSATRKANMAAKLAENPDAFKQSPETVARKKAAWAAKREAKLASLDISQQTLF